MNKEKTITPRDATETSLLDSTTRIVKKIHEAEGKPVSVCLKQHFSGVGFRASVMREGIKRQVMPIMIVGTYAADRPCWDASRVAEDAILTYRNLAA